MPSPKTILTLAPDDAGPIQDERQARLDRLAQASCSTHHERIARAAMRCGLSDAAVICDTLAEQLLREHVGRNGRTTKLGQALAAMAKLCGDEIWKYREKIHVPGT